MDIRYYFEKQRADDAGKQLTHIKRRLNDLCEAINVEKLPKYSGWYILLKEVDFHPSGYNVLCIFNPDTADEGSEPEWDYAISIKCKEDIPEFNGW